MLPLPLPTRDPNVLALARQEWAERTGSTSATWDLGNQVVEGYIFVWLNGTLLRPGVAYTVSGSVVTLAAPPLVGDWLAAYYHARPY